MAGLLVTNQGSGTVGAPLTGLRGDASGDNAIGVRGITSARGTGVRGDAAAGVGVRGTASSGAGVRGESKGFRGVEGISTPGGVGVRGFSDRGAGVRGQSNRGTGVEAAGDWGVSAEGDRVGAIGLAQDSVGVGVIAGGPQIGLWAGSAGLAGLFEGDVFVNGDFVKTGMGSCVAVPLPDKSLCRLHSIESPESWFEDFGEHRVVKGRAEVVIDPKFASLVRGTLHVFLTPYGDSGGLYVSRRSRRGFAVREHGNGKSTLAFSYRVVARRKDIRAPRLEKVTMPSLSATALGTKGRVRIPGLK
jgi:hypothetical protein